MTFFQAYLSIFFFKSFQITICLFWQVFLIPQDFSPQWVHEAEGGQDWLHISPKPLWNLLFLARGLGLFSLLNSLLDKVRHVTSYVTQACFCPSALGLVLPVETPRWSLSGSSSLGRDMQDPGTCRIQGRLVLGLPTAARSRILIALPIPFLKGID